ncbi:hypothetical protein [Streptomyces sp. NPDC046161]|uniref:hypothetical protein n=1 Tax=Streptomyces sp. NPDC046161 TaxID=3155132 RepID=UPI0033C1EE0D
MADALAPLLRALRVRAGNPSYRAIERLISNQGRREQIRRATIQEKISGKSPANLVQVLSIVEALADYARSMGAPLADEEVDARVWRERVSESVDHETLASKKVASLVSQDGESQFEWGVRHLRNAGMHDVIDFVTSSQRRPVAEWLPEVIRNLRKAKMSRVEFLDQASKQDVAPLMDTVVALHLGGGALGQASPAVNAEADEMSDAQVLLHYAAKNHMAVRVPVILVALRRAEVESYAPGFIRSVAEVQSAENLVLAIEALHAASLYHDASDLLAAIGAKRMPGRVLEVVEVFRAQGLTEDADGILEEIGAAGEIRVLAFCRTIEALRLDRGAILSRVAAGMDWSDAEALLGYFEAMGESGMAEIARNAVVALERLKGDAQP